MKVNSFEDNRRHFFVLSKFLEALKGDVNFRRDESSLEIALVDAGGVVEPALLDVLAHPPLVLGEGLGPGVDHAAANGRISGPERHQSPAQLLRQQRAVSRSAAASPASPAANKDWAGKASRQLTDLGIWD